MFHSCLFVLRALSSDLRCAMPMRCRRLQRWGSIRRFAPALRLAVPPGRQSRVGGERSKACRVPVPAPQAPKESVDDWPLAIITIRHSGVNRCL